MRICVLLFLSQLLFGCSPNPEPQPEQKAPINEQIIDTTLILGISPLDSLSEVLKNPSLKHHELQQASLEGDSLFGHAAAMHINLSITDDLVTGLDADIYPLAQETALLWQIMFDHICTLHGKTSHDDGFAAWTEIMIQDRKFEIHLTDDSKEVGRPYIGLVCNEKY